MNHFWSGYKRIVLPSILYTQVNHSNYDIQTNLPDALLVDGSHK